MTMKTPAVALAAVLILAGLGHSTDSRAQDGVFAGDRVVPGDAWR
jgi:hypothetical protein